MADSTADLKSARKKAEKLGWNHAQRTLLMCVDKKEADCCSAKAMDAAWKHLRGRLKQRGLTGREASLLAIKTRCIDVCKAGPILGVMPDGVWYGRCNAEVIDRIVEEHLIGGNIVEAFVIADATPTT